MKKILLIFLLAYASILKAQEFPEPMSPPRLVNDFAEALSAEQETRLEQKLVAFNDSTSTQIALVFIGSTGPYDIGQYGVQLAEKWGIGQADKRNGILLLTAIDDREVTIQVGYGLEPVVTDAISRLIIEQDILPNYRQQQYYQGVDQASDKLMQLAVGEFPADLKKALEEKGGGTGGFIFLAIFVVAMLLLFGRGRRRTQHIGSGRGIPPVFWGGMLGSGGRRHGGFWGDFNSGGGGFGGGFGGGGFGGFGGGSFGGGGASGGW